MTSLQRHSQSLLTQGRSQGKPQGKRSRMERGAHRVMGSCRIGKAVEGKEAVGMGGIVEDPGTWGVGGLRA